MGDPALNSHSHGASLLREALPAVSPLNRGTQLEPPKVFQVGTSTGFIKTIVITLEPFLRRGQTKGYVAVFTATPLATPINRHRLLNSEFLIT